MDATDHRRRGHRQPWARLARLRKRAAEAAGFSRPRPLPDASAALPALARAWVVTTIATTLLIAALAIAPLWDREIYLRALRDALCTNPEMALPLDDTDSRPASEPVRRH
jgi:hypothetical protein